MDLCYWEPQRQAIATQYRFIAYNLLYHGTAPWPNAGQHYSVATYAADLAAVMRWLNAGPVHLAGLSSGGRLVTMVALAHPDLVRSLTLAEPALAELLAGLPEAKAVREELRQALELIRTTASAGEAGQAATLFFERAHDQGAGTFDTQPEAFRRMILDNARTVRLQLSAPRPPAISRTTLRGLQLPTLVVGGEHSRRHSVLGHEVLVQCIPGSRLLVIPQATHLMSHQNPTAFNEALLPSRPLFPRVPPYNRR